MAIVMFAPHALAWPKCVRHLGSPQNAVGFELTSQDSIREPHWLWVLGVGKELQMQAEGMGTHEATMSGGHHPPQHPLPNPLPVPPIPPHRAITSRERTATAAS